MAHGATKFQKYLARKRQKEAERSERTAGAAAGRTDRIADAPIHECLVPAGLFEEGIGNLVFSRSLADGRIALGVFLVDVFCLGVKNALFAVVTREEYSRRTQNWSPEEDLQPMEPSCFRKLVEGAVTYARNLGLHPHADYAEARWIFGDVDAMTCTRNFEYGHKGKPLYISGPNETRTQARNIVRQLERQLGPKGFEYLVMA